MVEVDLGVGLLLMGAMFDVVFRSYASAFEKRADVVYAKTARV